MKKTLTITMIVIILLNLISIPSFAAKDEEGNLTKIETTPQEEGNVEITNKNGMTNKASIMGTDYSNAQNSKTAALVLTAIPRWVNLVLNAFVDNMTNGDKDAFTIYDTIMGSYDLFDIDFTYYATAQSSNSGDLISVIKSNVLKYYAMTRAISIAISLLVLIYIGIRMAITTIASDRAKYKKMLLNWAVSLILVFLMHIFIITISYVLKIFMDVVNRIAALDAFNGVNQFEEGIYSGALAGLNTHGFQVLAATVLIYVMTWYQLKFFFYYLHRTLEVNFLVIISPLVTITYPIDKAGDNRAQAFGALMKEIIMKSAIQVVHAFLYIVFVATAGLVAQSQPILAIIFFAALSRAEKITRNVFGVDEKGFERIQLLNKIPFLNR